MIKYDRIELSIFIIDRPGSLNKLLKIIDQSYINITSIHIDRISTGVNYGECLITLKLKILDYINLEIINTMLNYKKYRYKLNKYE